VAGVREHIAAFAARASLEITSADKALPASLAGKLPAGAALYVAHVPGTTLADVAETACIGRARGFSRLPAHRREAHRLPLRARRGPRAAEGGRRQAGPARRGRPGIARRAVSSTLDIIESGALEAAGIDSIGVAGHPDGHANIQPAQLRDALKRKQAYAARTGVPVHVVTQFGFDPGALVAFDRALTADGITLPVHVGVAGPASLKGLAKFAMLCGIGTSLAALIANPAALKTLVKDGGRDLSRRSCACSKGRSGSGSSSRTSSRSAAS
jgi:methylenetetrahydrofolate reductase (NADPH)